MLLPPPRCWGWPTFPMILLKLPQMRLPLLRGFRRVGGGWATRRQSDNPRLSSGGNLGAETRGHCPHIPPRDLSPSPARHAPYPKNEPQPFDSSGPSLLFRSHMTHTNNPVPNRPKNTANAPLTRERLRMYPKTKSTTAPNKNTVATTFPETSARPADGAASWLLIRGSAGRSADAHCLQKKDPLSAV